ncbi:MAG: hypothetical protein ACAI44_11285 [Candidatus Sericytochromatia bacterium]
MHEIYAYFASAWLEQKLLPLALTTVGLPPETSLDDLALMNLPLVNSKEIPFYANSEAGTLCCQRPLFCAAMLAEAFVRTPQASRMLRAIYGLMWKDGTEFAIARDLDMALNLDEFRDGEASDRCYGAMDNWERWANTDQAVLASQQDFLSDCVEQRLAKGEPLEDEADPK